MDYKHTQTGYLTIFVLLAVALIYGVVLTQTGFNFPVIVMMLFVLFVLASFWSLQVTIDKNSVRIKFSYGIFCKQFLLKEIDSAKAVKNHWYYGFGIKLWLWPTMWIYNISGFDAVEITMKNGKRYRIGTDEPKQLERAIMQAIKEIEKS